MTCRKLAGQLYPVPNIPPLVKTRVQQSLPLDVTGIGALYVKGNGGETKLYICSFPCAVSCADHLEIVTNLNVECFLQSFRRLGARRSCYVRQWVKILASCTGRPVLLAFTYTCFSQDRGELEVHSQEGPLVWGILGEANWPDQIGFEEGSWPSFHLSY